MGIARLALAGIAFAIMFAVTAMAYDMGTLIRRDPLLMIPVVLMPNLWLVAAATLTTRNRGSAGACVAGAAVVVTILDLLLLDHVYARWSVHTTGGPMRLVLGWGGDWVLWLEYPICLIALAIGLVGWWRGRPAAAWAEWG